MESNIAAKTLDILQSEMVEAREIRDAANADLVAAMDKGDWGITAVRKAAEAANDVLLTARNAISKYIKEGGEI